MKDSDIILTGLPKITNVHFDLNKDYDFKNTKEYDLGLNVNTKINEMTEETLYEVVLIMKTTSEEEIEPFNLSATISGIFKIENNMEEMLEVLKVNGPAILTSYLRPYISNITLAAGIEPVTIPILNFNK